MRLIALLAAVLLAGCTTYMTVEPSGMENVTWTDGRPLVTSKGAESTVSLIPSKKQWEKGAYMGFYVSAENHSTDSMLVDSSNVTATSAGNELRVWSYDERMNKIRRDEAWANFGAALAAAGDGMNQAQANTYSSGSATAYGYGNSARAYGTSTSTTTYSGLTQADMDRRNRERFAAIEEGVTSATDQAELILDKTTLPAGGVVDGFILMNQPKVAGPVTLKVQVGKDLHTVVFDYQPVN